MEALQHLEAINMAEWIKQIVQARWLVASLGEHANPPWWRSQATAPVSIAILERLYPRTALVASLEIASRAACFVHDAPLARTGQYHLFRLPVADDLAVREWLRQPAGIKTLQQLAAVAPEDRLASLAALADREAAPNGQGPVNCGSITTLHRKGTIQKLCAVYVTAFSRGYLVVPYLEGTTE